MKDLTFLIITFLRDEYLFECIKSIRKIYGNEPKIIVGENDKITDEKIKFMKKYKAEYYQLPFDSGVCVGRNTIIEKIKTKYVCVGDDDFYYDKKSKVDVLYKFLKQKDADLVGGRIFEAGQIRNYQGFIDLEIDHIKFTELDNVNKPIKCDLTFNYFVAKTKTCKEIKWDENIKVRYEHSDFFISLKKANKKVYFHPEPIVIHKKPGIICSKINEYKPYRMRKSDKDYYFNKHGIDYIIDFKGKIQRNKEEAIDNNKFLDNIDFIIKTFKRYDCLNLLLNSIKRHYPKANIIIVDDSDNFDKNFYITWRKELNIKVVKMLFDSGLSAGRNKAVEISKRDYILLLDDDFVFTEETKIEKLYNLIRINNNIGAVGGMCLENKLEVHFECNLSIKKGVLQQLSDGNKWGRMNGIKYKQTQCILNFGLFRRKMLLENKWDNELKLSEHQDFFIRLLKTDWKIYYTPNVKIDHLRKRKDLEYKKYRQRGQEYLIKMFKKHNITKQILLNGSVKELKDNKIVSYRFY